jgi:tetratricopeptide (TPR) repeat protein
MEELHPNIRRGLLLMEQNRFPDAVKELQKGLAANPESPTAYALLGECLVQMGKPDEALEMAKQALNLDAENPFHFSVLAKAYFIKEEYPSARKAIDSAIEIDPYDSHYYHLRGHIAYHQKDWNFTLVNAEKALEIDPENVDAINLRSLVLVKLDRRDEAAETADYALHKEPENPYAHANKGWAELNRGKHEEAQKHFREALRLSPMNEMAKSGLKESIKAKNPLYRLILNYFLWMNRMSERNQWAFIIGVYVMYRATLWARDTYPALAPVLTPLIILYIIFAFSTWIAVPVSNLALRLHPLGKYALDKEEKLASTLVGSLLTGCLVLLGVYIVTGDLLAMLLAGWCGLMALPTGVLFNVPRGTNGRKVLTLMAIAIGVVGLLGLFVAPGLISIALIGIFAFGWVANYFAIRA